MSDDELSSPVPSSSGVPTRLLRRLSIHNDKIDGSMSPTPTRAPQLSVRNNATQSPPKRQLKNYDMKELENRNGGLGWVGPIYGNKTHSSRRYASPVVEDRAQAAVVAAKTKPQSFAEKKRRGSTAALEELYPDAEPAARRGSLPGQLRRHEPSPREPSSRSARRSDGRKGESAHRDSRGGRDSHEKESPLIIEQKRLLRLLQESIRVEEAKGHSSSKSSNGRSHRHSYGAEREYMNGHGASAAVTSEPRHRDARGGKRHSYPVTQPARRPPNFSGPIEGGGSDSNDTSEVSNGSSTSSSDSEDAFERANPYRDDRSVSSLEDDARDEERHYASHARREPPRGGGSGRAEEKRGRDRNAKKSTNRVRYEHSPEQRPRPSRAGHSHGFLGAQQRYGSPTNTSSTVAAARAGISHNFFELYGGRPGGVRVPEKVKITSMIDKATPIRNPAEQRRRLASPTVSSGRRFHTPELDRVHSRRGASADSYTRDSGSGLTDAAEWSRLTDWLGRLRLQKYAGLFRRSGITKLSLVELLRGHDLAEIGIDLNDHQRILQSIQDFSHRTISFAEDALSPHEERFPQSSHRAERVQHKAPSDRSRRYDPAPSSARPAGRESTEFVTAKDVLLTGERRRGAAYRPMSTEDLLRLGSPEAAAPSAQPPAAGGGGARLSQSQEVKPATPSPAQDRMARSAGTALGGGVGAVLSSTPTGVAKQAVSKAQATNPVIEATLLSLNKAFWVGDEALFYKIWDAVVSDLGNRPDASPAVVQAAHLLELFSRVYFVTWPQRAQSLGQSAGVVEARARFRAYVDRVLGSPDEYTTLLRSREFATFVGIGMLPDAASNAAYASLFKSEWADGLARRLNSFLSNLISASAPPQRSSPAAAAPHSLGSPEVILGGGESADEQTGGSTTSEGVVLGSPDKPELADMAAGDHAATDQAPEESESARSSSDSDTSSDAGADDGVEREQMADVATPVGVENNVEPAEGHGDEAVSEEASPVEATDTAATAGVSSGESGAADAAGSASGAPRTGVEKADADEPTEQDDEPAVKPGREETEQVELGSPAEPEMTPTAAATNIPLANDVPETGSGADGAEMADSNLAPADNENENLASSQCVEEIDSSVKIQAEYVTQGDSLSKEEVVQTNGSAEDPPSGDEVESADKFDATAAVTSNGGGGGNKKKRRKSKAK